jgi:hypothetical protein
MEFILFHFNKQLVLQEMLEDLSGMKDILLSQTEKDKDVDLGLEHCRSVGQSERQNQVLVVSASRVESFLPLVFFPYPT